LASLAVFLPEAGAWRLLPTTHLLGRFSAELAHGDAQTGSFALLKHQQIESSEDEAIMMETLIKEAPENAVFAKVFMAYASVPGDFVIIPSYKKILFCDEEINTTPGFTVQSNTLPNGPVSYALVAYWTIGERACSAPLKVETIENVL
jgi:hypothetical protein